MLMYSFTKTSDFWCCKDTNSGFKHLKSITTLVVFMFFLFGFNAINAQVAPCIDGEATEWGSPQLQANPTFELRHDVFTGNQDDI